MIHFLSNAKGTKLYGSVSVIAKIIKSVCSSPDKAEIAAPLMSTTHAVPLFSKPHCPHATAESPLCHQSRFCIEINTFGMCEASKIFPCKFLCNLAEVIFHLQCNQPSDFQQQNEPLTQRNGNLVWNLWVCKIGLDLQKQRTKSHPSKVLIFFSFSFKSFWHHICKTLHVTMQSFCTVLNHMHSLQTFLRL